MPADCYREMTLGRAAAAPPVIPLKRPLPKLDIPLFPSWPMIVLVDDDASQVRSLISEGGLFPVFQPIFDYRLRSIFGYEALIRGPEGSPLHRPDQLFAAATRCDLRLELEHACREVSLRAFAALRLSGRLFLNASPGSLLDPRMMNGQTRELLAELGLAPNRIVIELTENQQITDLPGIEEAIYHYRGRGFQIAIDDLGEGFANLRMWSQLRPEFVKIDRHFVHGIADDRIKFHFVRAMQDLAEICNASLVAEGIERAEDFVCIRDMGIACGQGYFIARPAVQPVRQLPGAVLAAFGRERTALTMLSGGPGRVPTAASLLKAVPPVAADASNDTVIARFESDAELDVLPVVNDGLPVGMINRHSLIDRFARPFRKELFGRKCCQLFMDPAPLVVDAGATIQELAMMLSLAPRHYMFDGFIVTQEGRYAGIGSAHDLMAMITEMQIHAARYANPLTQLPGNVPINERIDALLAAGTAFVAAYVDIDNFKPFNDTFGYRRGDDVIQALARQLTEIVDPRLDFVGHIGGDDFFVLFRSEDWELRCQQLVSNFSEAMRGMVGSDECDAGGYMAESRRGEYSLQALPTLSVGAVRIEGGDCDSHREVAAAAAAAKKQAKKLSKNVPGSSQILRGGVFVERRRVGGGGTPATLPHRLN